MRMCRRRLQPTSAAAAAPLRGTPSRRPPRRRLVVQSAAAIAQQPEHATVTIAGAGIAGLATAVGLHKLGVDVVVLERAPALRQEGSAVALWSNAWRGLDALGVGQGLRGSSLLLDRIELVSAKGRLLRRFTFDECDVAAPSAGGVNEMRGVQRSQLLAALADQLPPGTIRFGAGVTGVAAAQGQPSPVLQLSDGSQLACDVCVGADGANSVVASHLGLPRTNYAGYVAYRGVAQYGAGQQLPMPPNTIRQMFGAGVRAGMYPLNERQVYWYVCCNADEGAPRPANAAGCVAEVLSAVRGWSWDIEDAVRATDPGSISRGAIRDRWTAGSFGRGRLTLAGDAAHPMTPNLGQGGCCAIEDGVVLARSLAAVLKKPAGLSSSSSSNSEDAVAAALRAYEAARSARCLPLTLRSYAFGAALQLPFAPVVAVRDAFVEAAFRPGHFLDHTSFDVGALR